MQGALGAPHPSSPQPKRATPGPSAAAGLTNTRVHLVNAEPGRLGWKAELAQAFTRPADLLRYLGIAQAELAGAVAASDQFRTLVPRGFAALMRPGDARDPLLLQVLPRAAELLPAAGFCADPVGDAGAIRAPGLLQKYAGRALLLVTGACAVHCRYCFRRQFPYAEHASGQRFDAALDALQASADVPEVILSGGDPLMLDDDALASLVARLETIDHLRRLRLHTRLPVVLPSRVTSALCRRLSRGRLRPVLVIHANHPAELDGAAADAIGRLGRAGIPVLNQSVLLRGINDDADVLATLAERLFDLGVTNYYLHQLDRVSGAAHFAVDDSRALFLQEQLRRRLPGYLVPRLVREQAGATHKTPLG
jgi:EF-P beta-lysylation protein EpmB